MALKNSAGIDCDAFNPYARCVHTHYFFSEGTNQFDNKPKQLASSSWYDFESYCLEDIYRDTEKAGRYICAPMASGLHPNKPEEYQGVHHFRAKAYAQQTRFLAFDLDYIASQSDLNKLLELIAHADLQAFCYHTRSSKPDKPRVRIIINADHPMFSDERRQISEELELAFLHRLNVESDTAYKFDRCVYNSWQPLFLPLRNAKAYSIHDGLIEDWISIAGDYDLIGAKI